MTSTDNTETPLLTTFRFRSVRQSDGAALWHLVRATGTLEVNSPYFYVLFATDFGATSLLAETPEGETAGAVIGYHPPLQPETAFVWQVGVHPRWQGQGLGLALLQRWLALPANARCRWVTATVADDNAASQALFRRLARAYRTSCEVRPHFTPDLFPIDHPAEPLFRVGPIDRGTPVPV
ncbi:diaminobutyrate acetyltransferase [Tepidicella baoligensis]|uniref:diaminobutyrate acetyltransferase n=1 Tax=Tepidicella baoligensis TaxID=2707016 RepID=UPI0015D97818|nr:diaminobutyrate acetyltransferase [Tepidicella baoligensis]